MAEIEGDRTKAPKECHSFDGRPTDCPNLVDVTPRAMDRETYDCDVCGRRFVLYYDEMQ